MLTKLKKLRGRSLDELRVRGCQSFAAFTERIGWSSQTRLPSSKGLLGVLSDASEDLATIRERFSMSGRSSFFAGLSDRQATLRELKKRWPTSAQGIIERAEQITLGSFDLLGFKNLSFGDPVDWHFEPISSRRSPLVHWSNLDELDAATVGDQKVVRELSRHQYFITLGQAYWMTGNERYTQTFTNHLASWMDQNPPKMGTHWASSLEIAFRSISWLWSFYFFTESRSLSMDLFARALAFLYLNARHLETYLSTYFSPNTHLTGEALGLFYLGTLLPEFRDAKRWRQTGREILLEQLERHVRSDGVYFEQSSYYHRYTADFYTHFLVLSALNNDDLPSEVTAKLEALMDHLMYITRPDGTTPLFGDDDGGRLMFLEESDASDFGAVLSNGAALFARPDYKFVVKEARQETLWLLGRSGLERFDRVAATQPDKCSMPFAASGFYVMRDSWSREANYLLFDCGPHGTLNCGHAHADALSFDLAARGRTLLVDPGTYTYTGSTEFRDWFRTSVAHNTLTIDGESSSVASGPFSWHSIAESKCLTWNSRDRFDFVTGSHGGYRRLSDPVSHNRSILFLKNDYWVIKDEINGREKHSAELHFHFAPGANPALHPFPERFELLNEGDLGLWAFAATGSWKKEYGWVSKCYGSKEPALHFVFSTVEADVVTFLLPQNGAVSELRSVSEIEAIGGKGFEVTHSRGSDVVMLGKGSGSHVETARLASDFVWTWARFANREDAAPTELLLLSGTSLRLEGREILKTTRRLEYLLACRVGDQYTVETNDGVLDLRFPVADFATAFSRLSSSEDRAKNVWD